jgi:hypothetical protein
MTRIASRTAAVGAALTLIALMHEGGSGNLEWWARMLVFAARCLPPFTAGSPGTA